MKKIRGLYISFVVLATCLSSINMKAEEKQRHIQMIMTTYNNNQSFAGDPQCVRCLDSILDQCYKNFSIIVVDNGSTDGTIEVLRQRVKGAQQEKRVTFIENDSQPGRSASHYKAVYRCKDTDIVMPIHATEMLAHEHVLQHVNRAYSGPTTWSTYAHSLQVPSYIVESPEEFIVAKGRNTRAVDGAISYPAHTFYAWLYKSINMQDFIYKGRFIEMDRDEPAVMSMAEMAAGNIRYMPEVMTVRTDAINYMMPKSRVSSVDARKYLSLIKPYRALKTVRNRTQEISKANKVDVLILAPGNTHQLRDLAEAISKRVHNIGTMYIIYDRNYSANVLKKVVGRYTNNKLEFVRLYKNNNQNRKELMKVLSTVKNEYILVASTGVDLRRSIDIKKSLRDMERTGAHAYYFDRGLDLLDEREKDTYISVSAETYAYQYMTEKNTWKANSPIAMAIYRRDDVVKQITKNKLSKLQDLISAMEREKVDESKIALISNQTKALSQVKKSKPLTDKDECNCPDCRTAGA